MLFHYLFWYGESKLVKAPGDSSIYTLGVDNVGAMNLWEVESDRWYSLWIYAFENPPFCCH